MQQGTDDWLNFRKSKIGASDAPVIMGVSPWTDITSLWELKVGLKENTETSYWQQRGLDLEDKAREYFYLVTGYLVKPAVFVSNTYNWMMASLDGVSEDQQILLEIKCPGAHDHSQALDGKIPEKYYPQLQHQLEVLNLNKGYYLSFDGESGPIIPFERDQKYINYMLDKEYEFYQCMENFYPPKLPNQIENPMWEAAALQLKSVIFKQKELETQEKMLKNTLLGLSNGETCHGNGVKLTKYIRKGSVDYDRIIKELDVKVDVENYRKEDVESWKITLS
jgi:putative phage-type endonuclease